jgi:hypothetical protein
MVGSPRMSSESFTKLFPSQRACRVRVVNETY